ncbi:MAG: glycosylase, partial [Lachnospiraceae bacterium]|nr:glycosylase [Lachnospiraceae bacterium]
MAATWLKNAVFYEIYPQSFYDTNDDGIGDINGIMEKLDYIKGLGCNAIWINPCFDSPFKDAGYDVRDYKKVAPRYGTNDDLIRLFDTAHKKGMHVVLDLVAGHTSEEHPWFRESQKAEMNEYSDRYIWTDFCFGGGGDLPYIGGESERNGAYILNFFKCQPALNYGFLNVTEPWQMPMNHPSCLATREALKDVMRFWLDKGCDGFRVDMAASLVKHDDERKSGTSAIWRDVRRMLELEYPETVMIAEWNNPGLSLRAGYDMDFALNVPGNGYSTLVRDYENHKDEDHSYFKRDAGGNINRFL